MGLFIDFIINLTMEELFNNSFTYEETIHYYLNGGCIHLADIIYEFVPEVRYMESKYNKHIGIFYKDNVYDAEGIQDMNSFYFITNNRLSEIRDRYSIPEYSYINGISVVEYMKNSIMNYEGYKDFIPREKSL